MTARYIVAVVVALAAGGATGTAADPAAHPWKAYVNVRFDYSVCFPADLLTPEPEAPNADGRRFVAKDGAVLLAYGSNNVLHASAATAARTTGARLGTVSYSSVKPKWFVVSGTKDTSDFYAKSLFVGDQVKSFELTYPRTDAVIWRPVAAVLNACFHSTRG